MSDSKQAINNTQSTDKIPTVQERKKALAMLLDGIRESITGDDMDKATKKVGMSPRTGYRYLNGKIAFLPKGQKLYNELIKCIKAAS